VIVGIGSAREVAACPLITGEEQISGLQDRVREWKGSGVQDPDVDGYSCNILQFLFERCLIPEWIGNPVAAVCEKDGDIDVTEGAPGKRPIHVGKENLLPL